MYNSWHATHEWRTERFYSMAMLLINNFDVGYMQDELICWRVNNAVEISFQCRQNDIRVKITWLQTSLLDWIKERYQNDKST